MDSRKNTLSLSVLELFDVAIAGNYEHIFSKKHSVGAYFSIYVYGRNLLAIGSQNDICPVYQGVKLAPDYRFYPIKNKRVFFEAKPQFAYIHFSTLPYQHYGYETKNIKYSLWAYGFGVSAGVKLPPKKVIITLVWGYQYFPIDVPGSIETESKDGKTVELYTNTDWWYQGGPGCPFVFKVLIGGPF